MPIDYRDGSPEPTPAIRAGKNYYGPLGLWCNKGSEESVMKNDPAVKGISGLFQAPTSLAGGLADNPTDDPADCVAGSDTGPGAGAQRYRSSFCSHSVNKRTTQLHNARVGGRPRRRGMWQRPWRELPSG